MPHSSTGNSPLSNFHFVVFFLFVIFVSDSLPLSAAEPRRVADFETLPFGQPPINYWLGDSQDVIALLQRRIEDEQQDFPFDALSGYLPALLRELKIPVESQLLLYASASPHRSHINAERPRAIYFNDDVSVAWHPGSVLLEFAAQDSHKGTTFYTLTNRADAKPAFHRSSSQVCLGCHGPTNGHWMGAHVPGHLNPSAISDLKVNPRLITTALSHFIPLEERWNNWYVTGLSPQQAHRGNRSTEKLRREMPEGAKQSRYVTDLAADFDTTRYVTDTSDAVAHLIFDHQMFGLNLLTRLSHEHQLDVRSKTEQLAVAYLLLANEAPLEHPVDGKSVYAEWYRRRGPKDDQGRSLYELDLETRLFRHRVSPLVHSRMMQNLPPELKQRLFERLNEVLSGREELAKPYTLPEGDRAETLAVLRATVPDWPRE